MDPTETLIDLVASAADGDHEMLLARAHDLAEWLKRGGFAPDMGKVAAAIGRPLVNARSAADALRKAAK